MKDVGVTAEKENLKQMIKALHGKSIPDHIRDGQGKMASIGGGGSGSAAAGKSPFNLTRSSDCCSRRGKEGGKERREEGRRGYGRWRHGRPLR